MAVSDPFATNWSNVDLEREGDLELVSGMSFNSLILEIETGSVAGGAVNRETLTRHFEQHLHNIATDAREVFHDNLDNIIAYGNRHAIAEALENERLVEDQRVLNLLVQEVYSNSRVWRPISQERFDYMLNCLPPIRMGRGGFMNSEPYDSLDSGEEIYFVALKWDGQCYATYGTVAEWDDKHLSPREEIPQY